MAMPEVSTFCARIATRRARPSCRTRVIASIASAPAHEHDRASDPARGTAWHPGRLTSRLSVVIPCLNEADNIEECVSARPGDARRARHRAARSIVVDNGSDDGSAALARPPARGSWTSRAAATAAPTWPASPPPAATYIVMVDADLTYDFDEIPRFVAELDDGADLVIGNRMKNIHPGAMPWHHRYIGNPLLSGFLNLLFRTGVDDAHCGMRALRRDVLPAARPPHDRDGVRLRDGDPRRQGAPRRPRVPDRVPPARRRVEAVELPRRLAPPALPARPPPNHLFIFPGARDGRARRARGADRVRAARPCSAASGTSTR